MVKKKNWEWKGLRLYQIVFRTPIEVQNKLEREKIENINDLISELKKFNDSYIIKKNLLSEEEERKRK